MQNAKGALDSLVSTVIRLGWELVMMPHLELAPLTFLPQVPHTLPLTRYWEYGAPCYLLLLVLLLLAPPMPIFALTQPTPLPAPSPSERRTGGTESNGGRGSKGNASCRVVCVFVG